MEREEIDVTGQPQEQEVSEQQLAKFNQICKQAAELAQDYQRQSEELKAQMISMVSIYNQNKSAQQAVPVDKIIQITNDYQEGMKQVQSQYTVLSEQLKKEEEERNLMMGQIQLCFQKLERMEKLIKENHLKKQTNNCQQALEPKPSQESKHQ